MFGSWLDICLVLSLHFYRPRLRLFPLKKTCQYPAMLTFRLLTAHVSNIFKYSQLRTSISSRLMLFSKNIYWAPSEARYTTVSFDIHDRILHGTKTCACPVFTHELLTHQKTRTREIMNQCVNNLQSTFQVVSCLSYREILRPAAFWYNILTLLYSFQHTEMLAFIAIWLGHLSYCCAYQKSKLAGQNDQGFSRGLCCA